jgi:hypothetical protein
VIEASGGIEIAMKKKGWKDFWINDSARHPIVEHQWMK